MNDQLPPTISDEPRRNNTPIIIGVAAVLLCCCCATLALGWFYGDQILIMLGM